HRPFVLVLSKVPDRKTEVWRIPATRLLPRPTALMLGRRGIRSAVVVGNRSGVALEGPAYAPHFTALASTLTPAAYTASSRTPCRSRTRAPARAVEVLGQRLLELEEVAAGRLHQRITEWRRPRSASTSDGQWRRGVRASSSGHPECTAAAWIFSDHSRKG